MGIEEIRALKSQPKIPKELRAKKPMAKKSAKKIAQEKEDKTAKIGGGNELGRWFKERRKEMAGYCAHCGARSSKSSDQYYKHSIAHLLPKRLFKSIATHPDNWIELCFFAKSCHTNFDNHTLDIMDLNCFNDVVVKFQKLYPSIAPKERKYIPDVLLQYLNTDQ